MLVILIVSYECENGLIGLNNNIPWYLPKDLQFFKQMTINNTVVMGRNTYQSLPNSCKPLPLRKNIILTQSQPYDILKSVNELDDVQVCQSGEALLEYINEQKQKQVQKKIYIIGGSQIYKLMFEQHSDIIDSVIVTQVNVNIKSQEGDKKYFNKEWLSGFKMNSVSGTYIHSDITYNYVLYVNKNIQRLLQIELEYEMEQAIALTHGSYKQNEELQYIKLLKLISETGDNRLTRGIDQEGNRLSTKSVFGQQLRFDLSSGLLPICTLRKSWAIGSIKELLWILSGSTNVKQLADQGVHVWDSNTSRKALDQYGFTNREEYDLGSTYGFNLRHFGQGNDYTDMHADYTGKGCDQLKELITNIKKDPYSRRHILSLWDPASLQNASLPPCSILFQFSVNSKNQLSLHVLLRSSDVLLALYSWNIPQYAVLCHIIAHSCNLTLGELIVSISDAHIYSNQQLGLDMIQRTPLPQPMIQINSVAKNPDQYTVQDIKISNYRSHSAIILPMAI